MSTEADKSIDVSPQSSPVFSAAQEFLWNNSSTNSPNKCNNLTVAGKIIVFLFSYHFSRSIKTLSCDSLACPYTKANLQVLRFYRVEICCEFKPAQVVYLSCELPYSLTLSPWHLMCVCDNCRKSVHSSGEKTELHCQSSKVTLHEVSMIHYTINSAFFHAFLIMIGMFLDVHSHLYS